MTETYFKIRNKILKVEHSGVIKVGKDLRSDLVIDDDLVSRLHAVIEIDPWRR